MLVGLFSTHCQEPNLEGNTTQQLKRAPLEYAPTFLINIRPGRTSFPLINTPAYSPKKVFLTLTTAGNVTKLFSVSPYAAPA